MLKFFVWIHKLTDRYRVKIDEETLKKIKEHIEKMERDYRMEILKREKKKMLESVDSMPGF